MRRVLAVIAAGGCGRIGFAGVGDSGDPDAYFSVGVPVRVPADPVINRFPQLTWTGTQFGIAWRQTPPSGSAIAFAGLSASGAKLSEIVVSDVAGNDNPVMVWTGSDHTLAWLDNQGTKRVLFGRIGSDGSEIGNEVYAVSSGQSVFAPAIAWTGSEHGIGWNEQISPTTYETRFGRLSSTGAALGGSIILGTTTADFEKISIVWTGTEYVVAWVISDQTLARIAITRLDASGAQLGAKVIVSPPGMLAGTPSLVWTGSELGLAWDNCPRVAAMGPVVCEQGSRIYFSRLDPFGAQLIEPVALSSPNLVANRPALVWTGREYAVAWDDDSLMFARLAADGSVNASLPTMLGRFGAPSLVATSETTFALAVEENTSQFEVYFQTIEVR